MERKPIREMRIRLKALFSRSKARFEKNGAAQGHLDLKLFNECKVAQQEDARAKEVRRLLKQGANPDVSLNWDGVSALAHAAQNESCKIAKLLLKAGANPNARDKNGCTPLMHATKYVNETATAKILLEYGADPNARDNNGWTPLMYAASKGGPELARLLLERGAFMTATSRKGNTALMHLEKRHAKCTLPLGGYGDQEIYDGIIKVFNEHRARTLKRITGFAFAKFKSNFRECASH